MEIINKKAEREYERTKEMEAANNKRKEIEAARIPIPTISFATDWRVMQEYNEAVNASMLFSHEVSSAEKNFLKMAIRNRSQLKSLVVDEYDGDPYNQKIIEIESDEGTISELKGEASKLKLSTKEYIRSIFYTTALKINTRKHEEELERKRRVEANKHFLIGRAYINRELKEKLEERFGEPKKNILGRRRNIYAEMLISLANEHFGLTQNDRVNNLRGREL
jgi:hypothetical protein